MHPNPKSETHPFLLHTHACMRTQEAMMVDGVRVSAHLSFGALALSHPLRRRCLALVQHPWFDAATLAVILLRHGTRLAQNEFLIIRI